MSRLSQLRLGTAPDSWGVWFASDPHQVTWDVYLDEIAAVGYVYTELGPQGFMPQDPAQLKDELARRNLTACGGTVFAGLHKGQDALDRAIAEFSQEARLLAAVGAEYLVHLPEQYTDQHTGAATESGDLDPEQWKNLVTGTDELAKVLFNEYGVKLVFHPHADTHVDTQDRIERFLADTDPELVNLWAEPGPVYGGFIVLAEPYAGLDPIRAEAPVREATLNLLNVFYAIEWALFAGFAIYLWYRLVRDAVEREREAPEVD